VLTGGGARSAYQVGALRALSEITRAKECPFAILTGISAGAINSVGLGCAAEDFPGATDRLWNAWQTLSPERVFRTDVRTLLATGVRWLRDVSSGGLFGESEVNYLLDTEPLAELLETVLPLSALQEHFRSGRLDAVAVSATNYLTHTGITFFDGQPELRPWQRSTRIGMRARLCHAHVRASAAIPIFFPPVCIDGCFFGDGGLRMTAPLSPAIHLGADKVVAIGVRHALTPEQTFALNRCTQRRSLALGDISGAILNAVFLDSLETDLERMRRINQTLHSIPAESRRHLPNFLRPIPVLALGPSNDLTTLVTGHEQFLPSMLRHLLRGIGSAGDRGRDLLSYLAFESSYVGRVMELGYRDTMARREEVKAFFEN
jgi:NTE family protein